MPNNTREVDLQSLNQHFQPNLIIPSPSSQTKQPPSNHIVHSPSSQTFHNDFNKINALDFYPLSPKITKIFSHSQHKVEKEANGKQFFQNDNQLSQNGHQLYQNGHQLSQNGHSSGNLYAKHSQNRLQNGSMGGQKMVEIHRIPQNIRLMNNQMTYPYISTKITKNDQTESSQMLNTGQNNVNNFQNQSNSTNIGILQDMNATHVPLVQPSMYVQRVQTLHESLQQSVQQFNFQTAQENAQNQREMTEHHQSENKLLNAQKEIEVLLQVGKIQCFIFCFNEIDKGSYFLNGPAIKRRFFFAASLRDNYFLLKLCDIKKHPLSIGLFLL